MRKINELKAGSILSYINLGISCIIPLFYTPIMLELMGQSEYGVLSIANSIIGYLNLLNFNIGSAIVRYMIRYRVENRKEEERQLFGLFITIYGALSLLVCIGGSILFFLADTMFGNGLSFAELEKLRSLIIILTLNTAISFPLGAFTSVVLIYEKFIFNRMLCIIETILAPILNLCILSFGFGSVGISVGALVTTLINGAIYAWYCMRRLHLAPHFSNMPINMLREIAVFSIFVFISTIVDMLYWATDKVLIGAVIGSVAVSVYNIGGTFTSMLQNMAQSISGVFGPRVNRMVAQNNSKADISSLMIRVGRLQYLILSLILSGYIAFGQAFIRLWVGNSYADAYWIALLTMIPLAVPLIQNVAFTTIVAENKHQFRSIVYAIVAVLNVISTYLVLPYYGIIGAAACTAVSFVLGQGIIMNIYYYRVTKLDIPTFWKNIAKMSIVPGCMIVAGLWLVNNVLPMDSLWWFLAWVIVYTAIFAALSWIISMNRYEKDLVWNLLKKFLPERKHT